MILMEIDNKKKTKNKKRNHIEIQKGVIKEGKILENIKKDKENIVVPIVLMKDKEEEDKFIDLRDVFINSLKILFF